jgi:hypothetical protein
MVNDGELRQKRVYVGFFSVACLAGATTLAFFPGNEGFQGALLRVGVLLAAFWLALPTKDRPAAWRGISSNWALFGGILLAAIIPRARAMFPILAIFMGIAWFARPKK